jgi:hypothetical protein
MIRQRFHSKRKTYRSLHWHIPLPSKFKIFLDETLNLLPRNLLILIKRCRITAHGILDHERGKLISRKIQRFGEESVFCGIDSGEVQFAFVLLGDGFEEGEEG